ncbi:MAG: amidohydrolase family protein, partial [Phycisphaerae bacterium]
MAPPGTDQASAAEPGRSFVVKAGRILPVVADGPWELHNATLVVRDGRIVAIGQGLSIPADLPVYEFPDATIMPGMIDAATDVVAPHAGDESVAAGYLAIDAFLDYADYGATLASGVTTVHLSPGTHRLVSGQGAVVRLGGPRAARVLARQSDVTVNLGDPAMGPPDLVEYQTPASSDVAIPPAKRQRPTSRMGQYLAIEEALARAIVGGMSASHDPHDMALAEAWRSGAAMRLHADRAVDLEGGAAFLARHRHAGYLVGGAQAAQAAEAVARAELPLVYRMPAPLTEIGDDLGYDPDQWEADLATPARLTNIKLALATGPGQRASGLRLSAALAVRGGMDPQHAIRAITRIPAEILGVGDRVGSLAEGMDADFLVLSGDPLATGTHVERVFIAGVEAFAAPVSRALVVRAGTIWIDESTRIVDGAVLIEDGKIAAVGHTVPNPPFARLIDAGRDAFVMPGMIDARGHLGLDGDRSATPPAISLSAIVGAPDVTDLRVARSGITTVMLTPYKANPQGSQVAAIKTSGRTREQRIVRATSGVIFDFRKTDPMQVTERLSKRLDVADKYREKWAKYQKELAEWTEKQAKGEAGKGRAKAQETVESEAKADPITGTWSVTISGGPIPEPTTASMKLRLTGTEIEGRILVPGAEEAKVVATLDGDHISGEIQIDTGGMGYPLIEADIVEEDHIVGKISFQNIEIDLDANRTDKSAVEFKVVKRRTRGKGGRPLPPTVDEALEPLRAALDKKIPVIVSVRTAAQVRAVLDVTKTHEVPLILEG